MQRCAGGLGRGGPRQFRHMGEQDRGGPHVSRTCGSTYWGSVLDDARHERLGRDWRSGITVEERRPATSTVYTDGDRLAVEWIQLMPPAKWEPGHATDWREAVDSWFIDSLGREVIPDRGFEEPQARLLECGVVEYRSRRKQTFGEKRVSVAQPRLRPVSAGPVACLIIVAAVWTSLGGDTGGVAIPRPQAGLCGALCPKLVAVRLGCLGNTAHPAEAQVPYCAVSPTGIVPRKTNVTVRLMMTT
jgi:hypothetical protein